MTEQQVRLWMQQGDRACLKRQFIKGIDYYQRALELARKQELHGMQGRLCRDLGYVYLHHGAHEKALDLLEEGIRLRLKDPEIGLGLLVNKISVYLRMRKYGHGLETTDAAIRCFNATYPELSRAPSRLMVTYASLLRLRRDLKRVTELLDAGVNPERIQVTVQLTRPPWVTR